MGKLGKGWARAPVAAESKCINKADVPFSSEIVALRKQLRILRKMESQRLSKLDMTQAIEEEGATTGFILPATHKERHRKISKLHRETQKKPREAWRLREKELKQKEKDRIAAKDREGAAATKRAACRPARAFLLQRRAAGGCCGVHGTILDLVY